VDVLELGQEVVSFRGHLGLVGLHQLDGEVLSLMPEDRIRRCCETLGYTAICLTVNQCLVDSSPLSMGTY